MPRKKLMICGDCLRVMEFDEEIHASEKPCVCGSFEVCGCGGCEREARLLVKGARVNELVGIHSWIDLTGWTAENGLADGWDANRGKP